MAVRAVRGAVQVDGNERELILDGVRELVSEVLERNRVERDQLISIVFTATPDLTAEFPAYAARQLGITDVPLLCATEIAVPGAMPRVLRLLAHIETDLSRADIRHVYLRGAAALRTDLPQLTSALVVGAGLIGTSVGLALRQAGWTVHLSDADPARVALAADMGAGTAQAPPGLVEVAVVAVPPRHTAAVLHRLIEAGAARTYTDVASVKARVLHDLRALDGDIGSYVGGHPVAGRERGGPAAARDDLFAGRPWVLTPQPGQDPDVVAAVRDVVLACGSVPVTMAPQEHDSALAAVSHLPQLVSSALAAGLLDADAGAVPIAGQGLRDMVRIAASDADLWADIVAANAAALATALRTLVGRLSTVADALESGDQARTEGAVRDLVVDGNRGQARLPGKHGGPERPFRTVTVVVADRPGELARLLGDADHAGVNVEDIRVEHTPGRPTGVVELYVDPSATERLRAVLAAQGWSAH